MVPLSPQRHFQPVQREGRRGGQGNAHILSQDTLAFQEGGMNSFCKEVMGGLVAKVPLPLSSMDFAATKRAGLHGPRLASFSSKLWPQVEGLGQRLDLPAT